MSEGVKIIGVAPKSTITSSVGRRTRKSSNFHVVLRTNLLGGVRDTRALENATYGGET
jgi:hypothetical protein